MQRQTAIVVVVLVTITLLFFMGVGAGLLQGDGKRSSPRDSPPDWVAWMGGLLAPFSPRVDLERLQCANQPLSKPFRLDRGSPQCEFTFSPTDNERPRQATLEVNPASASVYVRSEQKPPPDHDPACVPEGGLRGPLILKVSYGEPPSEACWLPLKPTDKRTPSGGRVQVLEVRFAVLEEGGTVVLECKGCSDERRLELAFAR